jgi:hypothetical protein
VGQVYRLRQVLGVHELAVRIAFRRFDVLWERQGNEE